MLETNKNPRNFILEDKQLKYRWDNFLKKSYEKQLGDISNHFVRHFDSVSTDCKSNIHSLIEEIVSSAQNVYIHIVDVLKKVRKFKTNNKVHKNKQWFNKEC